MARHYIAFVVWAVTAVPMVAQPTNQSFPDEDSILQIKAPNTFEQSDSGKRYQASITGNDLVATADGEDGKEFSRLSVSRIGQKLYIDLLHSGQQLAIELPLGAEDQQDARKDSACGSISHSPSEVRGWMDWVDFLDSSTASGKLGDQTGLVSVFSEHSLRYLARCTEEPIVVADLSSVATKKLGVRRKYLSALDSETKISTLLALNYSSTLDAFCFLSVVQLRDVDTQHENTYCRVELTNTSFYWRLWAVAGDSDSDAFCEATCILIRK